MSRASAAVGNHPLSAVREWLLGI